MPSTEAGHSLPTTNQTDVVDDGALDNAVPIAHAWEAFQSQSFGFLSSHQSAAVRMMLPVARV